jgi:predicted Zn-dependent protease with MMP-like domain
MLTLTLEEFEQLVAEGVDSLPPFFLEKMQNIELLIAAWPTKAVLRRAGVNPGSTLLGLYEGVPLTKRTSGYMLVTPDIITIFQGPIERAAGPDVSAIRERVRHTVIHEIAHHFGISDERLIELGAY